MEISNKTERNFDTVSPSAKMLLLMKGYTPIPFARQAAELIMMPEKYIPDYKRKDFAFWARTVHLENRYWSINQLLEGLNIKNILELSSGFSFRSLEAVKQEGIYYIDTDLPGIIETKKNFIHSLSAENYPMKGKLEVAALNALDEKGLRELVSHFPPGEIAIVNEGLLMYLNMEEKERLCKSIHAILKERGGYWITADIYIKTYMNSMRLNLNDEMQQLLDNHHVDENRFESVEEAGDFFKRMGFVVDKEATMDRNKVSTLKYLLKNMSIWKMLRMRKAGKIQYTWRLKVAP